MQILSLSLFASAPLNDVYRRPYTTIVTQDGMNALDNVTQGGRHVTQLAIAKVANQFIQPTAETEGVANIVNGWQTPRFRFLLEVMESHGNGISNHAYYVGHTDYAEGATIRLSGNRLDIDPQLNFFVNAVHRLKVANVYQQHQLAGQRQTAERSAQILYGNTTIGNLQNGGIKEWKIRPVDVFRSQSTLNQLQQGGYLDNHVVDTTGSLLTGCQLSARRNNSPGSYMFDTVKGYSTAAGIVQSYSGDTEEIIEEAITHTDDGYAYQDPFFLYMRDAIQAVQWRGQFTWGQLKAIAPYVDDIATVFNPSELARMKAQQAQQQGNSAYTNVWHSGNTASWHGSNMETIAATLVVNAVPTIMLENLAADMRFTLTNMTADGSVSRTINTYNGLSKHADPVVMMNRVLDRVEVELVPAISQQNQIPFILTVDCSVYGDTFVEIGLNGQPPIPYVMPTFADNAASPVLTQSQQRFNQIANDMFYVSKMVYDNSSRLVTNVSPVVAPPPSYNQFR